MISKRRSLFDILNWPKEIRVIIFLFFFILLLCPYFSGLDFGILKIPDVGDNYKKFFQWAGPLMFLIVIFLFLPLWDIPTQDRKNSEPYKSNKKPKVFLFYTKTDFDAAEKLYNLLRRNGFVPWMEGKDIFPSLDWKNEIHNNMKESDFILVCLSQESYKNNEFQKEIEEATEILKEKRYKNIRLFSVKLDNCENPNILVKEKVKVVDYFFDNNSIIKVLNNEPLKNQKLNNNTNSLLFPPEKEQKKGIIRSDVIDNTNRRLPKEVFVIELLERPVRLQKINKNHSQCKISVKIDRQEVNKSIITTEAKTFICNKYIKGNEKKLKLFDKEIHDFLSGRTNYDQMDVPNPKYIDKLPLRWASGGVLSVIKYKDKLWTPFFFRDIKPIGWNIALGASERYFDQNDNLYPNTSINDELNNPWMFIIREFFEEFLILNRSPHLGISSAKMFYMDPSYNIEKQTNRALQFANEHIELRQRYDGLNITRISPNNSIYNIKINPINTNTDITVISREGVNTTLDNVLVSISPLELGIEVVKVVSYSLNEDDYLLDGEIFVNNKITELVRMPTILLSHDYLKKAFGSSNYCPKYTEVEDINFSGKVDIQPSIIGEPITPDDVHIFDWDIIQRLRIKNREKRGIGNEEKRYKDWYKRFGKYFFDENDMIINNKLLNLFVPPTAKLINLYFNNINMNQ